MFMNLLHHIINEKIFLELFLQDQDFMLGFNAIETIEEPDLELVREDTRMVVAHDSEIFILRLDMPIKRS